MRCEVPDIINFMRVTILNNDFCISQYIYDFFGPELYKIGQKYNISMEEQLNVIFLSLFWNERAIGGLILIFFISFDTFSLYVKTQGSHSYIGRDISMLHYLLHFLRGSMFLTLCFFSEENGLNKFLNIDLYHFASAMKVYKKTYTVCS